ncbi:AraC family transcriptional regulator [Leucobacter sp. NPDC015123]|uniref:AraC family transcriptional regulator n=1 Tax=Leucobacter sp. NPDC015123 TaxID=3364129 RepID=UPI0036F48D36
MRNVSLAALDGSARTILPIATDYPPGHLLDWHEHRRAQLLYAAAGTMLVETADGAWTIPGERAVLIPPLTPHRVRMLDVQTNSLYIEPGVVPWWPVTCRAVDVPPLLRELLRAAADLGRLEGEHRSEGEHRWEAERGEERAEALLALILIELEQVREAPLNLPLPAAPPLAGICRAYISAPDVALTNADWAAAANVAERTLNREFRAATGMSPGAWRARARLLAAIPLLQHQTVAEVSGVLGYASPAAFSFAFARAFGEPPSALRRGGG